ncbi:hypothetical protein CPB83DRAFT_901530 [Crepidotus variabilis]|uniref:Uncharacterized protein n=1 Tax=Crepidotus variabilis TaxID=179855 RepID=A0A9P6ETF1_9AGAR|nr:hypothetical protein CPB83DRAFT_901530 [Crepidotus variabilis]
MHSMFHKHWRAFSRLRTSSLGKTTIRLSSTSFLLRLPPSSATREVPTPLLFVSSGEWDKNSTEGMTTLAAMLAEKGFTCIETNLARPLELSSHNDSRRMMEHYESDLVSQFRLTSIPFPPVILARSSACLIAQTYISSHPASAMILINPPASNKELQTEGKLPNDLEEFTYEPHFPIAVITGSERQANRLREISRICQSDNVDLIVVEGLKEGKVLNEIELWLDQLGI